MRVLGYGFDDRTAAVRTRKLLTDLFGLRPADARVGDLAEDGVVLAIRAGEDKLPELTEVLAEHGGELLIEVDERSTRGRGP